MTKAGYIHDQRCPTDPSHGNALVMDNGYWCPHEGHTPPKGPMTQAFWNYNDWEAIKRNDPTPQVAHKPHPSRTRAIKEPRNG